LHRHHSSGRSEDSGTRSPGRKRPPARHRSGVLVHSRRENGIYDCLSADVRRRSRGHRLRTCHCVAPGTIRGRRDGDETCCGGLRVFTRVSSGGRRRQFVADRHRSTEALKALPWRSKHRKIKRGFWFSIHNLFRNSVKGVWNSPFRASRCPSTGVPNVLSVSTPVSLFLTHVGAVQDSALEPYVVSADVQRFLIDTLVEQASAPITLLFNWNPH